MRFSDSNAVNWSAAQKAVRHLVAAEGYLELDLPGRALAELECIPQTAETSELQPYVHYLTGESLKDLEQFPDAINSLHEAARTMPAPFNRTVWTSLGECFRQDGQPVLAEVAEMFAEMNPELVENESLFDSMNEIDESPEFELTEDWQTGLEGWSLDACVESFDNADQSKKPRFEF